MKIAKTLAAVAVALFAMTACYLFQPATANVTITVTPSYLTVGPGEQQTVSVSVDPPTVTGVAWAIWDN